MGRFFTVGAVGDPPALLLTASGDLDLLTVGRASVELSGATGSGGPPMVVVDVTGHFVGARGMRVLVEAVVRARRAGRCCAVAGVLPDLLDRLAMFDAEGLPFFGTLDEAVGDLLRGRDTLAGG